MTETNEPKLVGTQRDAAEALREVVRTEYSRLSQNGGPQARATEAFIDNANLNHQMGNAIVDKKTAQAFDNAVSANNATLAKSAENVQDYDALYKADVALEKAYGRKVINDSDAALIKGTNLKDTEVVTQNKAELQEYLKTHKLDANLVKQLQSQISSLPQEAGTPNGHAVSGQKPPAVNNGVGLN